MKQQNNRLPRTRGLPLLLAGATAILMIAALAATAAPERPAPAHSGQVTAGGGTATSARFIQSQSIIGQGVILGTGSSTKYRNEATLTPPVTQIIPRRNGAQDWQDYE